MRILISALWLMSLVAPGTAVAQAFPPNEAGVTMGHWHRQLGCVEANQKILVGMGGTAIKPGDFNIVRFPGVAVFLHLRQTGTAPTGGTDGSGGEPRRLHRPQRPGGGRQVEGRRRAG